MSIQLPKFVIKIAQVINQKLKTLTKPMAASNGIMGGLVGDIRRSKSDLILENAFLRQQLLILNLQVKQPQLKPRDRLFFVLLTSRLPNWRTCAADREAGYDPTLAQSPVP